MRVSNDSLRQAFLTALEAAQKRVADTQNQVSTGRRVNTPSDDPVAAARISQLDASLARLDQYKSNGTMARNQLGLEEETLAGVIDNLQSVRELVVQANSDALNDGDRALIAQQLRERRDALLALANTTNADGKYLFAGYAESSQPFTIDATGAVSYNGDQGQRTVQVSDTRFIPINDSGAEVFQRIPSGNGTFTLGVAAGNTGSGLLGAGTVTDATAWVADDYSINFTTPTSYEVRDSGGALVASGTYTAGQSIAFRGIDVPISGSPAAGDSFAVRPSTSNDVFTTLDSLISTLETSTSGSADQAKLHSNIGQLLQDVDQATNHVIASRSNIGARSRALDDEATLGDGFSEQLTRTLSDVRDLDYAEALSRLSQQLLGLDAAQKAYAQTQGLSLFRYL